MRDTCQRFLRFRLRFFHADDDASAIPPQQRQHGLKLCRSKGEEAIEPCACDGVPVMLQRLADTAFGNQPFEIARTVDDRIPRRAYELRKRHGLHHGCRVPRFGVHGPCPCICLPNHDDDCQIGGDGHHVWKAMFPAQSLRWSEVGVAAEQAFDKVCARRPFTDDLIPRDGRVTCARDVQACLCKIWEQYHWGSLRQINDSLIGVLAIGCAKITI